MKEVYIYKVLHSENEYYFSSLAAIYSVLSEKEIGCKVQNLWSKKICETKPYISKSCTITKHRVISKEQLNKKR